MCKFFSCVSNGQGHIWYFDWELRKKCLSGELDYNPDSHTSIADYYGFKGAKEDRLNKYEFNPITKYFEIDAVNVKDDSEVVQRKLLALDFQKIVPALKIKDIIHPFKVELKEVTSHEIELLKQWASVRDSVEYSVGYSVRDSVEYFVGYSVGYFVGYSVWYSVWDSVRDSVWDSVRDSVWDSVRDSVWDSVWANIGGLFELEKWKYAEHLGPNPWESNNELWELGFVPSFDGKTWRLHSGKNATIVFEWTP